MMSSPPLMSTDRFGFALIIHSKLQRAVVRRARGQNSESFLQRADEVIE